MLLHSGRKDMSLDHWTLDDIPWDDVDRSALDPGTVALIKAACMVEHNGADYATYLCNVFRGDDEFCAVARQWAEEEVQHGRALRRWAEIADPDFDFDAAFAKFTEGYQLPLQATASVRGSRTGELIARCVVEVGTSSYYSALRDSVAEPVLANTSCSSATCGATRSWRSSVYGADWGSRLAGWSRARTTNWPLPIIAAPKTPRPTTASAVSAPTVGEPCRSTASPTSSGPYAWC
jgi:hypothetical protein